MAPCSRECRWQKSSLSRASVTPSPGPVGTGTRLPFGRNGPSSVTSRGCILNSDWFGSLIHSSAAHSGPEGPPRLGPAAELCGACEAYLEAEEHRSAAGVRLRRLHAALEELERELGGTSSLAE